MQEEVKTKKATKRLIIILVAIVVIIAALAASPFILALTVREFRTIKDVPAPTQVAVHSGSASFSGPNWAAAASFLAEYEIQGLVVGVDDYSSGSIYDRAIPRDISIAWGDMAANSNLVWWQRGEREMAAEVSALSEWLIGKKYEQLFSQYSNNHLIAKEPKIRSEIMSVKKGDYIKLSGYLVDLKLYEKDEKSVYYQIVSSLVRDDTGDGACEVMYVTDIEFLD